MLKRKIVGRICAWERTIQVRCCRKDALPTSRACAHHPLRTFSRPLFLDEGAAGRTSVCDTRALSWPSNTSTLNWYYSTIVLLGPWIIWRHGLSWHKTSNQIIDAKKLSVVLHSSRPCMSTTLSRPESLIISPPGHPRSTPFLPSSPPSPPDAWLAAIGAFHEQFCDLLRTPPQVAPPECGIFLVVADLNGCKDTIKMLASLNDCFPHPQVRRPNRGGEVLRASKARHAARCREKHYLWCRLFPPSSAFSPLVVVVVLFSFLFFDQLEIVRRVHARAHADARCNFFFFPPPPARAVRTSLEIPIVCSAPRDLMSTGGNIATVAMRI